MNNRFLRAACVLALISAAGCGGGKEPPKVGAQPAAKPPAGNASAEQVAKEMRGNVRCPAQDSKPRAANAPVDDVVGIRPGMPIDEAANFAMCDNPLIVVTENKQRGYNINTFGAHIRQGFDAKFAEPRVEKTSQQILKEMQEETVRRGNNTYVAPLKGGQARYYVSSMGLPGQELVLSVAREEYFPDGKLPTVDNVKKALIGKYGEPTDENDSGQNAYLWWVYDPSGNKAEGGSSVAGQCKINVSPDSGTSLSNACGVQVGALIQGTAQNAGLAHSLAVTVQNGALGMAVLRGTEQALAQGDASRKAKELNDASKNSAAPKL